MCNMQKSGRRKIKPWLVVIVSLKKKNPVCSGSPSRQADIHTTPWPFFAFSFAHVFVCAGQNGVSLKHSTTISTGARLRIFCNVFKGAFCGNSRKEV